MSESKSSVSSGQLILIPAVITLAITLLRLYGELQGWNKLLFKGAAGGGGAIVGISWLPFIFGPYFAWKLIDAGEGPTSTRKAITSCLIALLVFILAGILASRGLATSQPGMVNIIGFIMMLGAAFYVRTGWRTLAKVLFVYALAARIPVLIVMWFAMSANGGRGWGTHYDAVPAYAASANVAGRWLMFAFIPQVTLWVAWTVVFGALVGIIVVGVAKKKPAVAAA